MRTGAETDGGGGQADGVLEVGCGDAGRGRDDRGGVVAAGAVEAEQGVEVDGSAGLVLGGLAVRQADRGQVFGGPGDAAVAGELDEVAFDVLLGAPPQFPGGGVPHDVGGVVVAVHAQRRPEARIAGGVPPVAGQGAAVRALSRVAAGVAGFGLAVAVLFAGAGVAADGPGVDRAEGRGGEGGEYERVPGHGLRDALASGQARRGSGGRRRAGRFRRNQGRWWPAGCRTACRSRGRAGRQCGSCR